MTLDYEKVVKTLLVFVVLAEFSDDSGYGM